MPSQLGSPRMQGVAVGVLVLVGVVVEVGVGVLVLVLVLVGVRVEVGVLVEVGGLTVLNVAVTPFAASIVRIHVLVPLHPAPLQPAKVDPLAAVAVRVT